MILSSAEFESVVKCGDFVAGRDSPGQFQDGKLRDCSPLRVGVDVRVNEEVPPTKPPAPKPEHLLHWEVHEELPPEPSLKLDMESIRVHEVQAVEYSWEEYEVARIRIEKLDKPAF